MGKPKPRGVGGEIEKSLNRNNVNCVTPRELELVELELPTTGMIDQSIAELAIAE
jgi:hypothetical protein